MRRPALATLAIDMIQGKTPDATLVNGKTHDWQAKKDVPSVLETPEWVTPDKVEDVVKAGQAKASDICTGGRRSTLHQVRRELTLKDLEVPRLS